MPKQLLKAKVKKGKVFGTENQKSFTISNS